MEKEKSIKQSYNKLSDKENKEIKKDILDFKIEKIVEYLKKFEVHI